MVLGSDKFDIHGVSETLFIPLSGRAAASRKGLFNFSDLLAEGLVSRLKVPRKKYLDFPGLSEVVALRSLEFDRIVLDFYNSNLNSAVVLSLGVGLCTRFERIKSRLNPRLDPRCMSGADTLNATLNAAEPEHTIYLEVDLPPVMALREQVIFKDERVHRMSGSFLEEGVWEELSHLINVGSQLLVVTEGLLMYFEAEQVRSFLRRLAQLPCKSVEVALDLVSPSLAHHAHRLGPIGRTGSRLKWGVLRPSKFSDVAPEFDPEPVTVFSLTDPLTGITGIGARGIKKILGNQQLYWIGHWRRSSRGSSANRLENADGQ